MNNGLGSLIHPLSIKDFQKHFLKNEPFLVQHDSDPLQSLLSELPFLHSLDELLKVWPASIQVHLPDLRDEVSSLDTDAVNARSFYDQGMGLLFNEAHNLSPVLDEWLQKIKKELGVSQLTYARNLIYCTPDGVGTAAHFDQNINFVLQLKGTKKWWVAPNTHIQNPLNRHTIGQPVEPEMMSYLSESMPDEMPSNAKLYELKPGALLFVPRGCWHSTEALGDAIALNFTFTAPAWVDIFTAALRSRLIQSEDWRKTADLNEEELNKLLLEVIEDLPNWNAADILEATESSEE